MASNRDIAFQFVWEFGGDGKTLWGGKYEGNLRNPSKNLKELFLRNDKLMHMITIILILKIL